MQQVRSDIVRQLYFQGLFSCLILGLGFLFPSIGAGETYGIKDPKGVFVPKVTVTVGKKDIAIKKTDPQQKFRVIAITLKNRKVIQNVNLLNVEWVDSNNVPGKAMPLAGPHYNPISKVFQDSMIKSASLRIIEKTKIDLFAGKPPEDLLSISIDEQPLVSAESSSEKERTVQLGTGRDVSISVDKTSIDFNESNLKKGEILEVDNRSGLDQVIGVELPDKSLLYFQKIIRKFEQSQVPRESWDRFTVGADSGLLIVLIPEPDPALLAQLNGKEILIKVYQGNKIRETIKVPIKTSPDLRVAGGTVGGGAEAAPEERKGSAKSETSAQKRLENAEKGQTTARPEASAQSQPVKGEKGWGQLGLWVFQIINFVLLVCLGVYGIFFMLPKIQVLQDRLAKNEMFIHGSREAIREEIEQIKQEILMQCEPKPPEE
jgi:hypothetical protein